jgi:predicted MFS family arabinose efflux permease
MKSNWPQLLCLALGAFAIGTESYALAGLLPLLSKDLGVTVALAGQLITAFALAYALGSPLLAVATADKDRRLILLVSISTFGLFNILAAFAPSYAVLFIARIGMALSAGTFMPAASAYAVAISPVERRGRSLSIIYSGLTFATVIGVPVGVLVGERLGWRSIFLGAASLALLALIGLVFNLRRVEHQTGASLAERIAIARRPDVLNALIITVVALTGAFTVYTYLAPFLAETTGLTGDAVAVVLFLFGFGSTIGNLAAGSAADRFGPDRVMAVILVSLTALFAILTLSAQFLPPHSARWVIIPVIGLWGFVGFSFPATQQARLVGMAPRLAPVTISLNASAIYLGISLGAVLGSLVVSHHAVARIGWVAVTCDVLALTALYFSPSRRAARAALETLPTSSPAAHLS